jgi:hypothetical protein
MKYRAHFKLVGKNFITEAIYQGAFSNIAVLIYQG